MPRSGNVLAVSAACLLASILTPALAQTPAQASYSAPRTSFGHPSFEGVWLTNFVLPLEATAQTPTLTVPEAAAKQIALGYAKGVGDALDRQLDPEVPELMRNIEGLAVVRGERRTRAIVSPADGKLPYTPEGKKEAQRGSGLGGMDNPEERPNWERCVRSLGQPPVFPIGEANPRQFIQTPTAVIVHTEYGGEARIIPFTDKHRPKMFWSLLGDSIARWEGDTLAIETVGLPDKDRLRIFPAFLVTSEAKVTERYTRLSDKELLYNFTIDDPSVYTTPWTGEFSIYKTDKRLYEHACHEGNYAMTHILQAARVQEEKAAKTAQVAARQ